MNDNENYLPTELVEITEDIAKNFKPHNRDRIYPDDEENEKGKDKDGESKEDEEQKEFLNSLQSEYTKAKEKVFEYPKNNTELFNIIRAIGENWREANKEIRNEGKKNQRTVYPLANPLTVYLCLKDYCHFTFIGIGNNTDKSQVYAYNIDLGLYTSSNDFFNKLITSFDLRYRVTQWNDIKAFIRTEIKMKEPFNDDNLIPVNNGIFNLTTKELLPFSPKYVITSKISTNYYPNPQYPKIDFDFDKWLNSIACNDDEIVTLLWQVMNEAINPNRTRGKMVLLVGEGNNGKGTFQKLLENLIGNENISNLKPEQFNGFMLSALSGKVCNIGDDISNRYLDSVAELMSIVTGDTIQVNPKHAQPYEATFKLLCLFSGNELPSARNKSQGWYRRLCIVPFDADFNGEKENPRIKNEYLKNKYLLEWVLNKVLNLPQFEKFIEPQAVKVMTEAYKRDNDFYVAFLQDVYLEQGYHYLKFCPNFLLKQLLTDYAESVGIDKPNLYTFGDKIAKALNKATAYKYVTRNYRVNFKLAEIIDPHEFHRSKFKNALRGVYRETYILADDELKP